jgi:phosphocarrier protein HPr
MESEENNGALSRDATIVNDLGLHARSAARIAQIAGQAMSKVWIVRGDEAVDAKSTIDLLTLACGKGSEITIKIDREEDIDVLERIIKMVEDGFGEQIS